MHWFDSSLMAVTRWLMGMPKGNRMAILIDEMTRATNVMDEEAVGKVMTEIILEAITITHQKMVKEASRRRRRELRSQSVLGQALYEECEKMFRYQDGTLFPFEARNSLAIVCGLYADKVLS